MIPSIPCKFSVSVNQVCFCFLLGLCVSWSHIQYHCIRCGAQSPPNYHIPKSRVECDLCWSLLQTFPSSLIVASASRSCLLAFPTYTHPVAILVHSLPASALLPSHSGDGTLGLALAGKCSTTEPSVPTPGFCFCVLVFAKTFSHHLLSPTPTLCFQTLVPYLSLFLFLKCFSSPKIINIFNKIACIP